jgi:uncharacterized SAM-binding protein YcdF (DUF218 family)
MLGLGLVIVADLVRFLAEIAERPPDRPPGRIADAIVVLTGGPERVRTGMALFAAGAADWLFVSGVGRDVAPRDLSGSDLPPPDRLACCVTLGRRARHTDGNALETADWARATGIASLLLVTASYHMPRARRTFAAALPEVALLPHPVFAANGASGPAWSRPAVWPLLASEWAKTRVGAIDRLVRL